VLALIATSMKSGVQDVRFRKWHKADLELAPFEVALWVRVGEGRSPVPPRLWVQVAQVRPLLLTRLSHQTRARNGSAAS
jgi:hypothetical protein